MVKENHFMRKEDLGKPLRPPVQPRWLDAWLNINLHLPQTSLGLSIAVPRIILQDIRQNPQLMFTLVDGFMDVQQIKHAGNVVAKAHAAHRRKPQMPENHTHENAHSVVIGNYRLHELWRDVAGGFFPSALFFSNWAEHDIEGLRLPPASPGNRPESARSNAYLTRANAVRIQRFLTDPRCSEYVALWARVYDAAQNALDSKRGKKLAQLQRDKYNNRKISALKRFFSWQHFLPSPEKRLVLLIDRYIDRDLELFIKEHKQNKNSGMTIPINLLDAVTRSLMTGHPGKLHF